MHTWSVEDSQEGDTRGEDPLSMGDGPAVQKLKKIIYPRSLSRRFEAEQRADVYAVRNADEKIICCAEVLELSIHRHRKLKTAGIVFHPLKGYDRETEDVEKFARGAAGETADPISLLLEGEEDNPRGFLSHKALGLECGLPLRDASCRILLQFAEIMEGCIPGIMADIDSEFLHDYRISIRKSRALLSLLKDLLKKDTISTHRKFLRECGRRTTPMRDLDVYLLEFPLFHDLLPPALNFYLEAFYDETRTKRTAEQVNLSTYLAGREYGRRFASWKKHLKTGDLFSAGADADSALVGRQLIARGYKKICKSAARISAHTSDKDLHALRIECKKLRYCIEFFMATVGEPVVDDVLSRLRTLQDVLGEFNDMNIQQAWLQETLNSQELIRNPGVQAALGGLMTSLYARQQRLREQTCQAFNRFFDQDVAGRIIELR
ncbi:MAG: CHAD domain-containing protein [Spirochaetales bacterium]|nr:CHAD domain-containing protein [Spirochaetales bacterium]